MTTNFCLTRAARREPSVSDCSQAQPRGTRPVGTAPCDQRPPLGLRSVWHRWLSWLPPIHLWLSPATHSPFLSPANTRRPIRVFLNGNVIQIPPK